MGDELEKAPLITISRGDDPRSALGGVPYPDWLSDEAQAARRVSHAHAAVCSAPSGYGLGNCRTGPDLCPEGRLLWGKFRELRERDRAAIEREGRSDG